MRNFFIWAWLVLACASGMGGYGASAAEAGGATAIAYDARIAGDDARTRLVIDLDREPGMKVHYADNPPRLIVDTGETEFDFAQEKLKATGIFSDIRYGRMGAGASRIVLTAHRPVRASLAEIKPNEAGKGYRLVLEGEVVPANVFAALVRNQSWDDARKLLAAGDGQSADAGASTDPDDILIAIDAGHGGIDTGTIGAKTKTPEKTVTLDFARALANRLNQEKGIHAFLTRTDDSYISLSERVVIARQRGAKLFISLHADTLRQKDIKGATVYTISDKASDKLAESLAERENLSDDIAGLEIKAEPQEVTDILLDLTRRETQAFSIQLAEHVVKSFEGQVALINNPLRHAGFRVLQAPDVPSILLELGFLSNPEDEKRLLDAEWRKKLVELLAKASVKYLGETGAIRGG